MVDLEKYLIDRLNALKSEKTQRMIYMKKMDSAARANLDELNHRIDELQRMKRKCVNSDSTL